MNLIFWGWPCLALVLILNLSLSKKNNRYVIYSLKSGGAPYITISVRGKISHRSELEFHYVDEVSKNAKPSEVKKALTSYFFEWFDWEEC